MDADVVVVGGGVVGLAVAAAFGRADRDVLVLEAGPAIGMGVSSRNSEVIHAGMYYPNGSLRHRMCVDGRRRLYSYLLERGVAHRKTGKLIVATNAAETMRIEAIHATGLVNGVEGLELINGGQARRWEPELTCASALWSSETGIVDASGYMLALRGEIEDLGGSVALMSPVAQIEPLAGGGFRVTTGGDQSYAITCRAVVNSAGLYAQRVASTVEGLSSAHIPKLTLAKGNYFACATRPAFSRLIYPAPVDGGLGVHVTLDLGGRMRFGPDVEWLATDNPDEVDYKVNPARAESFYAAIRCYWPGLPDGVIVPDYSGCRPKLSGSGEPASDFRIDGAELHAIPGLVNLYGIESPGLTSSLAIAEDVLRLLAD